MVQVGSPSYYDQANDESEAGGEAGEVRYTIRLELYPETSESIDSHLRNRLSLQLRRHHGRRVWRAEVYPVNRDPVYVRGRGV